MMSFLIKTALVAAVVALVILAMPDIKRYLAMRAM
jgi:hypothetical protein